MEPLGKNEFQRLEQKDWYRDDSYLGQTLTLKVGYLMLNNFIGHFLNVIDRSWVRLSELSSHLTVSRVRQANLENLHGEKGGNKFLAIVLLNTFQIRRWNPSRYILRLSQECTSYNPLAYFYVYSGMMNSSSNSNVAKRYL
jgi:hypothetical protein